MRTRRVFTQTVTYAVTLIYRCYFCSESFDLRAPKRKPGIRIKNKSHETISNRPPAPLPKEAEDDDPNYATVNFHEDGTATLALGRQSLLYDYAMPKYNTINIPRVSNLHNMPAVGKNLKVAG